ncbi:hypothetical protein LCGC14_1368900 [marine sediment metagenome]|uniref:Uncharacterized protein n=1 Tax=marine sediment metagenome TaxID=412755 RepID=A0A0F9K5X9_9ZZZZ
MVLRSSIRYDKYAREYASSGVKVRPMSLAKGDHLVIKRDGKILGPEDEAYHEFEVMEEPTYTPLGEAYPACLAGPLKVIA